MKRIFFFDLPVYRVTEKEYEKEWGNSPQNKTLKNLYSLSKELKIEAESAMRIEFGGPWKYNNIIGYMSLYIHGSQIRGEYYSSNKKRILRKGRGTIVYKAHKLAIEVDLDICSKDNSVIFKQIKSYIKSCIVDINKYRKKKRSVDTTNFDKVGKYIDWIKFIECEQG